MNTLKGAAAPMRDAPPTANATSAAATAGHLERVLEHGPECRLLRMGVLVGHGLARSRRPYVRAYLGGPPAERQGNEGDDALPTPFIRGVLHRRPRRDNAFRRRPTDEAHAAGHPPPHRVAPRSPGLPRPDRGLHTRSSRSRWTPWTGRGPPVARNAAKR